jgi:hypothetical protein
MMAYELPKAPTAFSLSPGTKKRPRDHNKAHLDFIRSLPCLVSGQWPVEAAHIRFGDLSRGKRGVGISEKPDDKWTVPLAPLQHRDQHAHGDERAWWEARGIDPIAVALALWGASGDEEAGRLIVERARPLDRRTGEGA